VGQGELIPGGRDFALLPPISSYFSEVFTHHQLVIDWVVSLSYKPTNGYSVDRILMKLKEPPNNVLFLTYFVKEVLYMKFTCDRLHWKKWPHPRALRPLDGA
jgi:hypothetical protein